MNPANDVPVAQLDRVSDSDSDGCRFDPCRVRQNIIEALLFRAFFYTLYSVIAKYHGYVSMSH